MTGASNEAGGGDSARANIDAGAKAASGAVLRNTFKVECYDRDGNLKWDDEVSNLVTNEGLDDTLDKYFKGSGYTAAWYVGLIDGGTSPAPSLAAGDTAAQIGGSNGWSELTGYSESVRQTLTLGSVSGQSVDNSASKASFSINASVTVYGVFCISDSTKDGTTGVLYGEAALASPRDLLDGDTLNVTYTLTQTSA